jgi:hypothetical protein
MIRLNEIDARRSCGVDNEDEIFAKSERRLANLANDATAKVQWRLRDRASLMGLAIGRNQLLQALELR